MPSLIILAGMPATMQLSGTSLTTTALGATNTLLPIVSFPKALAPGPKATWFTHYWAVFLTTTIPNKYSRVETTIIPCSNNVKMNAATSRKVHDAKPIPTCIWMDTYGIFHAKP